MIQPAPRARYFPVGLLAYAVLAAGLLPALARDGVSGCSVVPVEHDGKKVWRYTVELQVPQGGHCRVYISEDLDRKSWVYCRLKRASDNPVSATCDDPIDDAAFADWKAKAECGNQSFMAYCRQER